MEYVDSTHYLAELIKTLSNDRNSSYYKGDFYITATVDGVGKINNDLVECELVIQYDSVKISIYWEEYGYRNYREMGLYGVVSSKYREITQLSDKSFSVKDRGGRYELNFTW